MIIEVKPFVLDCSDKEQVCKVLEEAAEVFAAWQKCDECEGGARWCKECRKGLRFDGCPYEDLSDEIADVIQAACNLAERYGIDVAAAMVRCEERNRKRGRYGK